MNVLDIFSGIGGFSLGLERSGGFRTVAFCECEPYCRAVLAKRWPGIPCYDDVRTLTASRLASDGIRVDVICGGFPCQDISVAGEGIGIEGERSGLWREFARLIGELRPRFAIVENVAALTFRGLLRVLGDIAALGFDAEWHCIPACAVGAPHQRDRVWIIAYPNERQQSTGRTQSIRRRFASTCEGEEVGVASDTESERRGSRRPRRSDSSTAREQQQALQGIATDSARLLRASFFREQQDRSVRGYWPESWPEKLESLRCLDDGVSDEVGELAGYGNAVVPQIPEIIGRAIMKAHRLPQTRSMP